MQFLTDIKCSTWSLGATVYCSKHTSWNNLYKFASPDLCLAINVTIIPSPFTVAQEGQNITLSCVVSQRRRNAALPVVKWTFLPAGTDRPEDELLIARVNMRKARFYGNYTKSFPWPKLKLTVVKQGKIFDLLILNVSEGDQGLYMCRVQEFKKHQDRWKASSNSTVATELRGESWIFWWVFLSFSPVNQSASPFFTLIKMQMCVFTQV